MLKIIDDVNKANLETTNGVYIVLDGKDRVAVGAHFDGCTAEDLVNICINLQETIYRLTDTHPAVKEGFAMWMLNHLVEETKLGKEAHHEGIES